MPRGRPDWGQALHTPVCPCPGGMGGLTGGSREQGRFKLGWRGKETLEAAAWAGSGSGVGSRTFRGLRGSSALGPSQRRSDTDSSSDNCSLPKPWASTFLPVLTPDPHRHCHSGWQITSWNSLDISVHSSGHSTLCHPWVIRLSPLCPLGQTVSLSQSHRCPLSLIHQCLPKAIPDPSEPSQGHP